MTIEELIKELEKIKGKEGNLKVEIQYRDDGGSYNGTDDEFNFTIQDGTLIL